MINDIYTVFWRDWLVLRRRMFRFVISRMITPILYLVAFGWGRGRMFAGDGGNYLDFIVPGIIALNSMNISFNAVGTPLNISRLFYKTFDEYLIAPIQPIAFVLGKVLAGLVKGLLSSAVMIGVAWLFKANIVVNFWFVVVIMMNCIIFAAIAVVAALKMNSHEDMNNCNTYILLPMSFLCGTFFASEDLPTVLRWVIELLPLTHTSLLLRNIASTGYVSICSVSILVLYMIGSLLFAVNTVSNCKE